MYFSKRKSNITFCELPEKGDSVGVALFEGINGRELSIISARPEFLGLRSTVNPRQDK